MAYEDEVTELSEYDLSEIWGYAEGISRDGAELLHQYNVSPEGYGSQDFCGIYKLANGEYWAFDGWTDTTGWGCREDVTWYGPRKSVLGAASLLSQEHRRALRFEARAIPEDIYRDYTG